MKTASSDWFKLAGYTPKEETKPLSANEVYLKSIEKISSVNKAKNELITADLNISNHYVPIYSLVKQAVLGGTSPAELEYVIKKASVFSEDLLDEISDNLSKDRITIKGNDLEKIAGKKVNPENELFIKVSEYHEAVKEAFRKLEDFEKAAEALDTANPLEKQAESSARFLVRQTGNILKLMKNNPTISAIVGTGIVARSIGKSEGKNLANRTKFVERIQPTSNFPRTNG